MTLKHEADEGRSDFLILLTNDDGIQARGLAVLREELSRMGTVFTVAPTEERSATSHGLTLRRPLQVSSLSAYSHAVNGTPADCVLVALRELLPRMPDLVVSGINHGANLGDDVHYSGTVAAAREAALFDLPALAASLVSRQPEDFAPAAAVVRGLIEEIYPHAFIPGTFLNVNIPDGRARAYRYARQGSKRVSSALVEPDRERLRSGRSRSRERGGAGEVDTDYGVVEAGYVSVTPLQRDQTDYRALERFNNGGPATEEERPKRAASRTPAP